MRNNPSGTGTRRHPQTKQTVMISVGFALIAASGVAGSLEYTRLHAPLQALGLICVLSSMLLVLRTILWQHSTLRKNASTQSKRLSDTITSLRATRMPAITEPRVDVPETKSSKSSKSQTELVAGRAAALSPVSHSRSELLHGLLSRSSLNTTSDQAAHPGAAPSTLAADSTRAAAIRIAGIVSPELKASLGEDYEFIILWPTAVDSAKNTSPPDLLIIEERAIRRGPWFGAETGSGGELTRKLFEVVAWARENGVHLYGLVDSEGEGVNTPRLRASYSLKFPAEEADIRPHGIPVHPLHGLLQEYAVRKTANAEEGVLWSSN